jgi:hypothetical protein
VIVHTVHRTGSVGKEIVAEIDSGGYDLVILLARPRAHQLGNPRPPSTLRPFPLEGLAAFEEPAQSHDRKEEGVWFASSDTCSDSPNLQRIEFANPMRYAYRTMHGQACALLLAQSHSLTNLS